MTIYVSISQALSKALTELRADMVTQAQETVKARSEGHQVESNVQVLLEKHTRELQVRNTVGQCSMLVGFLAVV